jgi:YidC/Oxa1 family membrane protein insertase
MFVSQRMMPPMGDPAQQKMMQYVMPLMFGSFMIGLPAGLSLYYAFNNLLNIAQQLYLRKRFPAARPPVDAGKKKLATS